MSLSLEQEIRLTVNGVMTMRRVQARTHLIDFLRDGLGLTGSHAGCEHGVCGACTVRVDGRAVRGCLVLAAQLDGAVVDTIEGSVRLRRDRCAAGRVPPPQRPAMRVLHRRNAGDGSGVVGRGPRIPRGRRSARGSVAITAGAPATNPSSMRSRRWRPHEQDAWRRRPAQLLYRAERTPAERAPAVARAGAVCGRSPPAAHGAPCVRAQPLCPCRDRRDRYRRRPRHARRDPGGDGRRPRSAMHAVGRHAAAFRRAEIGAAIAVGRRTRDLAGGGRGRGAGGDPARRRRTRRFW